VTESAGKKVLDLIFRVDLAEMFRLSSKCRHQTSKATKKGHIHRHSSPGAKLLKRYNRIAWEGMRAKLKGDT